MAPQPKTANSSQPSRLVIIVATALGSLLFVFIIARLILYLRRRSHNNAAPLPPVQPLAHQREKQLAAHNQDRLRNSVYLLSTPDSYLSTSTAPLISPSYISSNTQSSGPETPPIHSGVDWPLSPPNPAFASAASSPGKSSRSSRLSRSYSGNTSSAEDSSEDIPVVRPTPPGSPANTPTDIPTEALPHYDRARRASASASAQSHRPISVASNRTSYTGHTLRSVRSAGTHRGAPHRPHSRVEIILPAPLAPQLYPYSNDSRIEMENLSDLGHLRLRPSSVASSRPVSMTDAWIQLNRDDTKAKQTPTERKAGSRRRHSQILPGTHDTALGETRRSSRRYSSTDASIAPTSYRSSFTPTMENGPYAPPVPRIPAIYNSNNSSAVTITGTGGPDSVESRGRGSFDNRPNSRLSQSLSRRSGSRSPSHPRTLRKASRG